MAIDWAADGRLWVADTGGTPENPGRVRLLQDRDGDGRYETVADFLDGIPCPGALLAWGRGVLFIAAPDLIYAEDSDGDGRADVLKRLFSGFTSETSSRRIASLELGPDHWIYGANGSRSGIIRSFGALGDSATVAGETDLTEHDFRFQPATGRMEPVAGLSLGGRGRDEWSRWFGCDAAGALWQYPLPSRYRRRNPAVPVPEDAVRLTGSAPQPADRVNVSPSFCIYRDDLFGSGFSDNAFIGDPDSGTVRCWTLTTSNLTVAAEETSSPFLSSTDPDFQPVQVRTGPDGALWIVDRRCRQGQTSEGRIHRVCPTAAKPRPILELGRLDTNLLTEILDAPNGTDIDRLHAFLLATPPDSGLTGALTASLRHSAREAKAATGRARALVLLDALQTLAPEDLVRALSDSQPEVRAEAVRLCEPFLAREQISSDGSSRSESLNHPSPGLRPPTPHSMGSGQGEGASGGRKIHAESAGLKDAMVRLVADPAPAVRHQLALSLGEWPEPRAGEALGQLAVCDIDALLMRAALLSSATRFPDRILAAVLAGGSDSATTIEFIKHLAVTAAANPAIRDRAITVAVEPRAAKAELRQFAALSPLIDATGPDDLTNTLARLAPLIARARSLAMDEARPEWRRELALRLLGREPEFADADLDRMTRLLTGDGSVDFKKAVARATLATGNPRVPELLLRDWLRLGPSVRMEIVGRLVGREAWALALLEAVDRRIVATSEVTPANRERLLTHPTPAIQERAATVLSARLPVPRIDALDHYESALRLAGDPAQGRKHFETLCAQCHAADGLGRAVGPDLSALRNRTQPELYESILDPAATIEPATINYQVETEDDRSLSGTVKTETGTSITLVQGGGVETTVPFKGITEMRGASLSLMPEGLEQGLTPQDVADVLAFVQSLSK